MRDPVIREGYGTVAWTRGLVKDDPRNCALAVGEWLSKYEWDWFWTQTFRDEISDNAALRVVRRTLMTLESLIKGPIGAFYAIEKHKYRGGDDPAALCPHIHMLVYGVREAEAFGLRRTGVWRMFFERYGRMRLEPYDPGKGATWYVGKYIAKEAFDRGDWGIWRPEAWRLRNMDLTADTPIDILCDEVGK